MGQQLLVPAETGPPGTEMTSISFRDQLWLSAYPLDRNFVFDYFALSPFYDRSCSNERLRMELIHALDMTHLSWVFLPTFSTKSLKFQGLLLKDS